MMRIFLVKKTPTFLILILVPILSLLAIFAAILNEVNIYGAWELSYVITLLLASIILFLPIIAYAEERITKSEKKYRESYDLAEFYKNLLAHDIRNVLQNIQSSSEIISLLPEQKMNNRKVIKYLQIINEQVIKGTTLVSNIYNLSKLSEAETELHRINLLKTLNESITYIKKSFTEKDIIVELNSQYKDIFVIANNLVLGVFENILINAVNYNENQKVEVQIDLSKVVDTGEKFIKLEIKDNGIGVPNNLKEKLFTRTKETPIQSKGLGLGLLLVYKIILSYNGKIWIEDRIEGDYTKGSNFVILIPEVENKIL
jgi:signal transduction histidine kinase